MIQHGNNKKKRIIYAKLFVQEAFHDTAREENNGKGGQKLDMSNKAVEYIYLSIFPHASNPGKISRSKILYNTLKILLSPHEIEPGLGVHIALDMQLTSQSLGATEEYTRFSWGVNLSDRGKHSVPVRAAKVRWGSKTGDSVLFCVCVVDHDVGCVVRLDFSGEILKEEAPC